MHRPRRRREFHEQETSMKTRNFPVWVAFVAIVLSGPALAQYTDWEQYTSAWHITAIAEAVDAVWVGTTGGLIKVDKNTVGQVQQYNTANSGLPSNHITALAVDTVRNQIWIGTFGKGLVSFDETSFANYRRSIAELGCDTVNTLGVTGDTLWIGTYKGLSRRIISASAWLPRISGANFLPSDTVTCLARNLGYFWIGTRRGVARWMGTGSENMTMNLQDSHIRAFTVDANDSLWVATASAGAARLGQTGWRIFDTATTGGQLTTSLLNTIQADPTAGVWIGTLTDGLFRYTGTAWTRYDTTNSAIPDNNVTALIPVTAGGMWVGTRAGGLARLSGTNWSSGTGFENGPLEEGLIAVASIPTGGRWACSRNYIYYSDGVNGQSFSAVSFGLIDAGFTSLAVDAQGRAWVGTSGSGIFRYNGTGWTQYSLDNNTVGFPDDFVNSVAISPSNGDVWIGTFNGVGRFNGTAWTTYSTSSNVAPLPAGAYEIQDVSVGDDGTVWISDFQSPGPIRFNSTSWVQTDASTVGITPGSIQSLWADGTGGVWVGTYSSGIARHSGGTWGSHLTTGLPSSDVRSIASDLDGNLWVGTAGGLARVIPPTQVAGPTVSNIYRVGNSGLPANSVRSVAVDPENRIYVATDSGGAIFSGFRRIPEPAVTIRNISQGLTYFFMHDTLAPGGSDTLRTYIVNTGTSALTIDSLSILQNGPLAYTILSQTAPPTITVPAGDSIIVSVRFHPTEVAFSGGQVRIVSNSTSSPDIIYTGGSVRAPLLTFTGDQVHVHTGLYAFFSIPYVLEDSRINTVLSGLGDYGPKTWRLYYYKGGRYLEYPEFTTADSLSFKPGIAFWLIAREALDLNLLNVSETPAIQRTGTGPTDWTTMNYRITLRPGWNMIGNPFAYNVNWSLILAATGVSVVQLQAPVVFYPGTGEYDYNMPVLEPWRGYFINNKTLIDINLEVPPMPGTPKVSPPRSLDREEFILELSGTGVESKMRSGKTRVGMLRTAEDGTDPEDYLEAPPIGERLTLSVMDAKGNRYAGNFKAASGEGATWDIDLKPVEKDRHVTLKIDGMDRLPAGFKAWLIDTDRECALELKDGAAEADVPRDGTGPHLKLIIGTDAYAESASQGMPLEPYKFALQPNYPNPFNPETRIAYTLEFKGRVSVVVFDGLGRKIRTLASGVQGAGGHEAVWNGFDDSGRPVPSGVYICRVRAGEFATSRKMALIR
jgi:ligand-binding sensor domain-containing protein